MCLKLTVKDSQVNPSEGIIVIIWDNSSRHVPAPHHLQEDWIKGRGKRCLVDSIFQCLDRSQSLVSGSQAY